MPQLLPQSPLFSGRFALSGYDRPALAIMLLGADIVQPPNTVLRTWVESLMLLLGPPSLPRTVWLRYTLPLARRARAAAALARRWHAGQLILAAFSQSH